MFLLTASWIRLICLFVCGLIVLSSTLGNGQINNSSTSSQKTLFPRLALQIGHTAQVTSVKFSRDGRTLVSGSEDGMIKLWDVATGTLERTVNGGSNSITFSPDGSMFAGTKGSEIWLRNARDGELIQILTSTGRNLNSLSFSYDGNWLVGGNLDNVIKVWDLKRRREMPALPRTNGSAFATAFDPKTNILASGGINDSYIRRWRIGQRRIPKPININYSISSLAFFPHRSILAAGSTTGTISLYDFQKGTPITTLPKVHNGSDIRCLEFSRNGALLASAATDPHTIDEVVLWNAVTGKFLFKQPSQGGKVISVSFSPDSKKLAAGIGNNVYLFETKASVKPTILSGLYSAIHSLALSPDGKWLAVGIGYEGQWGEVKLWDARTGKLVHTLRGHKSWIYAVAFSPDCKTLASADRSGGSPTLRYWDVESGKQTDCLPIPDYEIHSLSFSPRGDFLAGAGRGLNGSYRLGGTVFVWTVGRHSVRYLSAAPVGGLSFAVAFSYDGKKLAAGGGEINHSEVRVWNTETWSLDYHLPHQRTVWSLAFAPNSYLLASGSFTTEKRANFIDGVVTGGEITLWNCADGSQIYRTKAHSGTVHSLSFSADGKLLLSGSYDGRVKLWEVKTGPPMSLIPVDALVERDLPSTIHGVAFMPNSDVVISAGSDGLVRFQSISGKFKATDLISLDDDDWLVASEEGHFESSQIERMKGVNWIWPDSPNTPLSPAVFMQQFYEYPLLPKLLGHKSLRDSPASLALLNRTQPKVEIESVVRDSSTTVRVDVRITNVRSDSQRDTRGRPLRSGAYSIRLFRDQRLVPQSPKPKSLNASLASSVTATLHKWRQENRIDFPKAKNQTIVPIRRVQLPQGTEATQVAFTAYAFNEDRVKSETSTPCLYKFDAPAIPAKGRAYVIRVGVDANESGWNLDFAAKAARDIQEALDSKAKGYDVMDVELLSMLKFEDFRPELTQAKRGNIQGVLDLLAGRPVSDEVREEVDPRHQLQAATPDDLVMLFISSHGYADPQGNFYVIPYDTGESVEVTEEVLNDCFAHRDDHSAKCVAAQSFLNHSISSDDLAAWWRDVDAGEMVMILDSCHSAAVPGRTFRPGPLGDPGFGQLSYDKGMLILSATQPDKKEVGALREGIKGTLLSSALISISKAKPQETTAQWLRDAERVVPEQYRKLYPGLKDEDAQFPVLLDFTRSNHVAKTQ